MKNTNAIYFDMDGTIANLYGVNGWLNSLMNKDASPYAQAKPLVRLASLARVLNRLQRCGYTIGIVSWLAKNSTVDYDKKVTEAKIEWLKNHMPSVKWNEIHIVGYGTPKQEVVANPFGILFDDEKQNRDNWSGIAYDETNIIEVLKTVA